jgi:N-carbamoylputrescine amidase
VCDLWRAPELWQDGATSIYPALQGDREHWHGAPRNTVSLIDRHGEIILTYAKVHTCDFGPMEAACTPGDDFYVCKLDTRMGEIMIGAMICFDREFPESARILMLQGAELILTPNSCTMEANRIGQFRARAYENMVGVALGKLCRSTRKWTLSCFRSFRF